jgi:energy-coupling factor transporter ATP-binding protein EcfA2
MSTHVPPPWVQEIVHLLPACSHFVLSGNVRDKYFVENDDAAPAPSGMSAARLFAPELLTEVMHERSASSVVISYDIARGADVVPPVYTSCDKAELLQSVAKSLGSSLEELAPTGDLEGLAALIEAVAGSSADLTLVITSASRLTLDITRLAEDEFTFWRRIDVLSRTAVVPRERQDAGGHWINPVVWLLERERDVPEWFALNNVAVRSIVVPLPDTGQRERFARAMLPGLPANAPSSRMDPDGRPDDTARMDRAVATFRDRTAGLTMTALESVFLIARERAIAADDIGDAIDFYRTGVEVNPWSSEYLLRRIRGELVSLGAEVRGAGSTQAVELSQEGDDGQSGGDEPLVGRVLGQERAVQKAVEILARSAMGLTAAQTGRAGTRPRGVMFLAGPTGVGKTELAKAFARLVFGDEEQLLRFDMSEFSAEHSAARLIGAPPGYTGFDAGGELTNGIRRQPFSVVLFDEIEKAHRLILDKFLQILDDGRLTDGRGDTVHFADAIIVFTTNLGMYHEVEVGRDEAGNSVMRRVLNEAARANDPVQRDAAIREAIRDHFITNLGRPELLNRIGMDNIVVFDVIRQETGKRILDLMVGRVSDRVREEHELGLQISNDSWEILDQECLAADVMDFGGRGIGSRLETVLVNPLATALLLESRAPGTSVTLSSLAESAGIWRAELR